MLNRWHRLSLQVKMTLMIICIVGLSAATTEWLEARSIQHTVEDNIRDAALAVGRAVDQNVTSLAQLSNREARTKELEKILASVKIQPVEVEQKQVAKTPTATTEEATK